MDSFVVIEIEIAFKSHSGVCDRLIIVEINFLILDTPPKSFDEDVIKNTTSSVPTDGNMSALESLGKRRGGELTALVRVKNLGFALLERLFKRSQTAEDICRV